MKIYSNGKEITKYVGTMSLMSSVDTLGDQLDFEMAYKLSDALTSEEVNIGDLIILAEEGEEIFRGIVVTKTRSELKQAFTCFDFAFYLNKSKTIKQFNSVRADEAIKQLLGEFKVPCGKIANMPIIIKKIYFDKTVSDIIADILDVVQKSIGKKFIKEMNQGKLEIYEDQELIIKYQVQLANNLAYQGIDKSISEPTKTASIEEMKNSVRVYVSNDDVATEYAHVKNDFFISKYGLLEETYSLTEEDIAKAKNIAENLLQELGKVSVTGNITVLGANNLRAGRILELNEPLSNLVGKYKIKSATHTIGEQHTVNLELEGV